MTKRVITTMLFTASTLLMDAGAEGDQFLDGIGETALIARYRFAGNLEDGSRNSLHARMMRGKAGFPDDAKFGPVLSLGDSGVRLPGQALTGVESCSVAGWVKPDALKDRQAFFDMGSGESARFSCALLADQQGVAATLADGTRKVEARTDSLKNRDGEWMHLAVVLDSARKTLSIYVNGERTALEAEVTLTMEDMVDATPRKNRFLLGGPQGGKLHDVRFYRIALNDRQVAVIHHNAVSEEKWGAEPAKEPGRAEVEARLLYKGLTGVHDIEIATCIGQLPRLPYRLRGIYRDGAEGPKVRVNWPAPADNSAVQTAGVYTVTGTVPGSSFSPTATVEVTEARPERTPEKRELEGFAPGQVSLNPYPDGSPTPFMKHRDKFIEGLAKSDPDTFLYTFRDAFGQPHPEGTESLQGWDSQTCRLRGHASGHYLTAIAQAYAGTGHDPELKALFKEKMDTMVAELHALSQLSGRPSKPGGPHCADPARVPPGPGRESYDSNLSKAGIRTDCWNWGEGFISGYPPDQFIMLEQGASYGTGNNQVWAPYYTLHKILAGLMDCYDAGGDPRALAVVKGMGLWVYKRLDALPEETLVRMWNSYIAGEYGGMNESMARLYLLTGDKRFLDCARWFDNIKFFFGDTGRRHGLACNVDTLRGRHANQHIPQITGALETYKGTRDPAYYRIAQNFWNRCAHSYMYSIGGVAGARNPANAECFTAEPDTLFENGLSEGGQNETCATYNLLKLGRRLFMYEPDADYMDYYERALYNHILASVAEHDAGNTYHVPLNPGAVKSFNNAAMNGFTCCNGTALESATKLQNTIYLKHADDRALYVNLYVPSTLMWKERGIKITQSTGYPFSDTIGLTIDEAGAFTLKLRIPEWVGRKVQLRCNGKPVKAAAEPGRYLELKREWKDGDVIELKLPMDFHLMPLMDRPNIASVFYGPVLLAAEEKDARSAWRKLELDPSDIGAAFSGDPSTLRFEAGGVRFKPFFETYGRHSVYLDMVPEPAD